MTANLKVCPFLNATLNKNQCIINYNQLGHIKKNYWMKNKLMFNHKNQALNWLGYISSNNKENLHKPSAYCSKKTTMFSINFHNGLKGEWWYVENCQPGIDFF